MRRALALLVLVLPLAACGGTTSDVTSLDPVAQAADKTTNVDGAHFALTGSVVVDGKRIPFGGPGEIGDHGRAVHLRLSVPMAGNTVSVEAVGADGSFYLRGGPVAQLADGKWVRVKSDAAGLDLSQQDPSKLLEYLRATSKITKVGTDTVRGVHTTHYRARIQRQGLRNAPVDVWIGEDGLVRRIALDLKRAPGAVRASVDLFDFGDVGIKVPDDSETVDLGQLGGG